MSLLSKQDHDLAITALDIVIAMKDNQGDPAIAQMQQLRQWLKLQCRRKYDNGPVG